MTEYTEAVQGSGPYVGPTQAEYAHAQVSRRMIGQLKPEAQDDETGGEAFRYAYGEGA